MAGPGRWVQPVTLEGRFVRLEPLGPQHAASLAELGLEPEVWRWMPAPVTTPAEMGAFVEAALVEADAGRMVPFATIERSTGRAVGSTRFLSIEPAHRRLEIGFTWLARPWQRSAVNSEAKLLMLGHAFERLGALRVEFKTDSRNEQSRRALAGIGATEEGTLRRHMITAAGRRDSVYFSVIVDEWPQVRRRLEERLAR
ncbi:MAG TPA: GNAT family protein [Candidatus Limnocylindrales bacterium]|nr:GNAT family protein [Candidatus Limnocylindrales bacterium]